LVAVTEHLPAVVEVRTPFVTEQVAPLLETTSYVTAPLPEPPEILRIKVLPRAVVLTVFEILNESWFARVNAISVAVICAGVVKIFATTWQVSAPAAVRSVPIILQPAVFVVKTVRAVPALGTDNLTVEIAE
jgi:hypothetical protein